MRRPTLNDLLVLLLLWAAVLTMALASLGCERAPSLAPTMPSALASTSRRQAKRRWNATTTLSVANARRRLSTSTRSAGRPKGETCA